MVVHPNQHKGLSGKCPSCNHCTVMMTGAKDRRCVHSIDGTVLYPQADKSR